MDREELEVPDESIGVIRLDANYSPITRVSYRVEDTRVTAAFLVDGLHGVGRRAVHASPENRAREVAVVQALVRRMLGL